MADDGLHRIDRKASVIQDVRSKPRDFHRVTVAFLQNAEIIEFSGQHEFPQFRPVVETVAVGNILCHISHDRVGAFAQAVF